MKRISVMANEALLVHAIASILEEEIGPDVLQLTYYLPRNAYQTLRDHRLMGIAIDQGGSDFQFPKRDFRMNDLGKMDGVVTTWAI